MGQITLKEVRIEHETKRGGENKRTHHKMYIFIENETLLENLNNRNLRPFKMYREEVVPMVMEHLIVPIACMRVRTMWIIQQAL